MAIELQEITPGLKRPLERKQLKRIFLDIENTSEKSLDVENESLQERPSNVKCRKS
jgi:hypothetical protein